MLSAQVALVKTSAHLAHGVTMMLLMAQMALAMAFTHRAVVAVAGVAKGAATLQR